MYNHLNKVSTDYAFIPPQAFLYQPISKNHDIQNQQIQTLMTDDYIIKTKDNQIKRLIFEGDTKFTKFQNTKLQQFEHYLQRKKIKLDQRWSKSWRLRWLQSTNYDNKKTVHDMHKFIQYQDKNKEIVLKQSVQKYMKAGIYYLAGRDSKFRPILILNVQKMIQLDLPVQQIQSCEIYFFEFIMRNMLIPGQVQMWITIIDVGYQGVMSMMSPMKNSISFLQSTFRSRMYVAYIIRPSGTCSFLWSIAQKFLQQDTKRKVVFVEGEIMDMLLQYCNRKQLQKKFGGDLQNLKEGECWPPMTLGEQYESNTQIRKLTIEQYREKYQNNQLNQTKVYQPFIRKPQVVVQQKQQVILSERLKIQIIEKKENNRKNQQIKKLVNFSEISMRIQTKIQKLREQDLNFLYQLNLQAKNLAPQNDFNWLLTTFQTK